MSGHCCLAILFIIMACNFDGLFFVSSILLWIYFNFSGILFPVEIFKLSEHEIPERVKHNLFSFSIYSFG